MNNNSVPNFYVVGAARSATTSLYSVFNQSKDFFVPKIKEPNYFASDLFQDVNREYWRHMVNVDVDKFLRSTDDEPINFSVITEEETYRELYKNVAQSQKSGDFSTTYLYSKVAASRIFQWNSSAKIVIVLRNPVDRLVSHYQLYRRLGRTDLSLDAFLDREAALGDAPYGLKYYVFEHGEYAGQVKRYVDIFGASNVKTVLYENLVSDPASTVAEIFDFLGSSMPASIDFQQAAASAEPRSLFLSSLISRLNIKPFVHGLVGAKGLDYLRPIFFKEKRDDMLSSGLAVELAIKYSGDVDELEELVGYSLDIWRRSWRERGWLGE
tara:strand:- start:5123 stop:6097 length:975 start_codon:yes stop_codon:yes gene_type:complete